MPYDHIKDGMAIVYKDGASGSLMCCDCGLVHQVRLAIADDDQRLITMILKRDGRKTAAARKRGEGALQNNDKTVWRLTKRRKGKDDGCKGASVSVSEGEPVSGLAHDGTSVRCE